MADRFAARQCAKYTVISLSPDWCKTPHRKGKPLPYTVSIDLSGSAGLSPNVNINGNPAFLHNQSDTVTVKGDAPGQGKGVLSGTVGAKCEPITHSPTVRLNKKPLVRENDLFWMNNKNTLGKLTARESGTAAHITDTGRIASETVPNLWDDLQAQLEKGKQWVKDQANAWLDDIKQQEMAKRQADMDFRAALKSGDQEKLADAIRRGNALRNEGNPFNALGDAVTNTLQSLADGDPKAAGMAAAMGIVKTAANRVPGGGKLTRGMEKALEKAQMAQGLANGDSPGGKGKKGKNEPGGAGGHGGNDRKEGGKSKGDGRKCKSRIPQGECAEQLIEAHYKGKDFEPLDTRALKNGSGHGIDHAFKARPGELVFVETKGTATGGKMPVSKKQEKGGEKYTEEQLEKMQLGLGKGKGRWAAKENDVDFEEKLEALKEEMKGATLTYRVCRVQLEPDPSGCYGQRVSGKGKLSPAGHKTGFCRRKKGTEIKCEPWTPSEKPGKTR